MFSPFSGRIESQLSSKEPQSRNSRPQLVGLLMMVALAIACGSATAPKKQLKIDCLTGPKSGQITIPNVVDGKTYAINNFVWIGVEDGALVAKSNDDGLTRSHNTLVKWTDGHLIIENTDFVWGSALFTATLRTVEGGGQSMNVAASCNK
jgi:hypothetical protein